MQIEDNDTYEEHFKGLRDRTFSSAVRVLFAINKNGFLNGFDLSFLSMPVEHSVQHNCWAYHVVKMYLVEQRKAKMIMEIGGIAQMSASELDQIVGRQLEKANTTAQANELSHGATDKPSSLALNIPATKEPDSPTLRAAGSGLLDDLLTLLCNSKSPDRRSRHRLLGDATKHLAHQETALRLQEAILQDVQAAALSPDADIRRVCTHIRRRLSQFND